MKFPPKAIITLKFTILALNKLPRRKLLQNFLLKDSSNKNNYLYSTSNLQKKQLLNETFFGKYHIYFSI
ncbi:hypothetical protein D3797_016310 [Bacillus subtilis]|nr:hypothetical protein DKG76_05270 [Bacillus inaquosorum]PJH95203.1 hypothetical protein CVV77_08420 [Bacillus sp. SN1]PPA35094.1 hypothetical protein C4E21_18570 [Bacillus subtilis]PSI05458.1 hypothetical protein C7H81_00280 [Bacillus subtilis]RFM39871.1 hypothetical protein D0N38_03570 [Bacillus inaquosorum]